MLIIVTDSNLFVICERHFKQLFCMPQVIVVVFTIDYRYRYSLTTPLIFCLVRAERKAARENVRDIVKAILPLKCEPSV